MFFDVFNEYNAEIMEIIILLDPIKLHIQKQKMSTLFYHIAIFGHTVFN